MSSIVALAITAMATSQRPTSGFSIGVSKVVVAMEALPANAGRGTLPRSADYKLPPFLPAAAGRRVKAESPIICCFRGRTEKAHLPADLPDRAKQPRNGS